MQEHESSLKTLQDIRSMMEKSARFISLSGWSGVWAGTIALAGSLVATNLLKPESSGNYYQLAWSISVLAAVVFVVAFAGAFYFTWRKTKKDGGKVWNSASRRMMTQAAIPMIAGGIFILKFTFDQQADYIVPACLSFYGMALINGSKYTLSDIKYLGLLEVTLGCISLFLPGMALICWALGFGVLHIFYGIIVWNKYDKKISKEEV